MKVRLVKYGRVKYPELEEYSRQFLPKIQSEWNFELEVRKGEIDDQESAKILKSLQASDYLIIFDEHGITMNSVEFSSRLYKVVENAQFKTILLLVGGPFGIPDAIKKRANATYSLSHLTFTSDFALGLLSEQLYRAIQIKKGTSYHHE